jgi:ribonuclease J
MEGTLIGNRSDEMQPSESELEDKFAKIIEKTQGIVLVTTSSQNIDRLVTIFKAAKRCDRMFIIDFYTAEILEILKEYGRLPNVTWPRIRVCYPQLLAHQFEKQGWDDVLTHHRKNRIKWTRINEKRDKVAMLVRPGFMPELKRFIDLSRATWIYSMGPGYFERSQSLRKLKSLLQEQGVRYEYLHTSGHALLSDLKEFVNKLSPKMTIPIHSFHPLQFLDHFANVRVVADGKEFNI